MDTVSVGEGGDVSSGSRSRSRRRGRRVLMVMHPNFEDLPTNSNASAEPLNLIIQILPLKLPTKLLRKRQHLLLLICAELRPEPLLTPPIAAVIHPSRTFRTHRVLHFPVEVPVAPTRGALQPPAVHRELPAAVGGVASEAGCMVSQALSVHALPLLARSSFHSSLSFSFSSLGGSKCRVHKLYKPTPLFGFAMTTIVILGSHIYSVSPSVDTYSLLQTSTLSTYAFHYLHPHHLLLL